MVTSFSRSAVFFSVLLAADHVQDRADLFALLRFVQLFLEQPHFLFQFAFGGAGLLARSARRQSGHRIEHAAQGPLFPLVVGLAGDAQLFGRLTGGDRARLYLHDEQRPLLGSGVLPRRVLHGPLLRRFLRSGRKFVLRVLQLGLQPGGRDRSLFLRQ